MFDVVVWKVPVLDYGWVVSFWHRFNFLGTTFFFRSSLASATFIICRWYSSYKNLGGQKPMGGFHSREDGVFVFLSFFYGVTDFWSLLIVISKLMGPVI